MQPHIRSVAPAAAANVLENGISTATCTLASTSCVRERRHPQMSHQKSQSTRPPSRVPRQFQCSLHLARSVGAHRAHPCATAGAGVGRLRDAFRATRYTWNVDLVCILSPSQAGTWGHNKTTKSGSHRYLVSKPAPFDRAHSLPPLRPRPGCKLTRTTPRASLQEWQ